jgi:single-strand DNA-binding protein
VARSLNRFTGIGNVGQDPEMRYTPQGKAVCQFSLALNRRTPSGDETTWVKVVTWDKLAEIADQYVKKGARVYVEGRLQVRKYPGNDGVERTSVEVVANDLILLDGRGEGAPQREPVRAGSDSYDDLPF